MVCYRCKTLLDGDSRFCKRCGATIQNNVKVLKISPAEVGPEPRGPAHELHGPAHEAPQRTPAPAINDVHRDPMQEKPVWEGRPAWRSYYGVWALWGVACLILLFQTWSRTEPTDAVRRWVWIAILSTGVGLGERELLVVYGVRYRLTTQRLFIDRGILTRVTDQTELLRIDDVRIRQGIIDRIVNTGDIEVFASDDSDETIILDSVDCPNDVAEALRLHVRGMRGPQQTVYVDNV